jgi:hypothetical protein
MNNQEEIKQECHISMPIIVTEKQCMPCIELRKSTTDIELIKIIISAAFHKKPILIFPKFTDELKSLRSMQSKGLIYFNNEDQKYYWNEMLFE